MRVGLYTRVSTREQQTLPLHDLLHGHVTKNGRAQSAQASIFTDKAPATADKAPAPSTTPSKLIDKYGSPATSQKVAAEIKRAEGANNAQQVDQRTLAGRKAEAYEKLERGIIDPANPPPQFEIIRRKLVPPGMSQEQAAMLYNSLPNNLKMPYTPQPGSPEWLARVTRAPVDPMPVLPDGTTPEQLRAANETYIQQYMRATRGPGAQLPLHADQAWLAQHAKRTATGWVVTQNRQGSITTMTDASGNIVWQGNYDPYGNVTTSQGSTPPDMMYQGLYHHGPSGLYFTRTRAYSPILGRFLNRDRIGESGGINLYAYVGNDPIRYTDPSGMAIWIEGPSGDEPFPHKSICVGNPNGKYDCLSFCINPSLPNGKVYYDKTQGGTILRYKVTTPEQDAKFLAGLPKIGTPNWYGPCNNCRTFSEKQFDSAPGIEVSPPSRPPVGSNPPPFGWTTPPAQ